MRLLRRNVLLLYSVYLVSLLSGIVVTPIIVRVLGVEQYGIWSVIGSLAAFVILLDLGIGPTVIRFAAEQRGRGAAHETSELASAGLAIYGVLAVATVALGLGLAWVLPSAIDIPERLVWPARATLLLVVGGLAVRFPLGLFGNLLAGQQRYDVVNLGSVLGALLYAVSVGTVLLVWGGGLLVLGVVTFGVTVFRLALPLPWLRRELPGLRLQAALVTRSRLRELARFSLGNFLIQIASKVTFTTDVLVVGILLGTVAAGHYGIAAKLFALVFGIGVAGSNLLFPALAQMEGAAELERQRRYLLAGIRGGLAVVALAVLPLALLPDRLLALWLGGDYQTEGFSRSVAVLVLLVVSLLFIQPSYAVGQFLVARGRHARLAVARLATVSVNLGLSIALAATVGIWGVALATLVTEALFFTVAVPLLVRQSGAIEVSTLMGAWARPVVLAGLAASATLVPARLLGADSFLELGLAGAAWTAAFGALILRFGLEESERRGLANAFLRRRPAPAGAAKGATIAGERTALRASSAADLDLLAGWLSDPEVFRYWGGRPLRREEVEADYLGRGGVESFIVEAGGEPVGYIQAWRGDEDRTGGIDMFLAPGARGRGLGPDAARALVRHLLEERGWRRVTVDPLVENEVAVRGWQKAGFRAEREVASDDEPGKRALLMAVEAE